MTEQTQAVPSKYELVTKEQGNEYIARATAALRKSNVISVFNNSRNLATSAYAEALANNDGRTLYNTAVGREI